MNCADRPGSAHSWLYVDDLAGRTSGDWEIPGTPFTALLQPDGIVAWNHNQPENHPSGEEMDGALQRLVPDDHEHDDHDHDEGGGGS